LTKKRHRDAVPVKIQKKRQKIRSAIPKNEGGKLQRPHRYANKKHQKKKSKKEPNVRPHPFSKTVDP